MGNVIYVKEVAKLDIKQTNPMIENERPGEGGDGQSGGAAGGGCSREGAGSTATSGRGGSSDGIHEPVTPGGGESPASPERYFNNQQSLTERHNYDEEEPWCGNDPIRPIPRPGR